MQLKVLLSGLLLSIGVTSLHAQVRSSIYPKAKTVAAKKDSVATNKLQPKGGSLLASNTKTANQQEKINFAHVPLAGEKSYYGDKNEYMNDFVRKYMELHNRTLSSVQNNSAAPFSVIDNILEQKNLPKELKYLAVIESALNHNAVSHAGAVGPWQLMESTAKMMGLTVTRKNDDRKDWNKSTAAATKYLELLYSQLNDWLLVIAAYNSGPTPVQRAIERTGSHNFWEIKEYLPKETQGHVLAFIATASIFENLSKFISLGSIPVDFKFGKEEETPTVKDAPVAPKAPAPGTTATPAAPVVKKYVYTEEELKNMYIVRITEPIPFDMMVQDLGMDKRQLTRWNPDYDMFVYKTYPTPYYSLRLPKDKTDLFLQKKEALTKKAKVYYSQNR